MINSQEFDRDHPPEIWKPLIPGHLAGDASATDNLARLLEKPARYASTVFLGTDDSDLDDIVTESVLAVLQYILRREQFEGDIFKFTVTVARNRCRNLFLSRKRNQQVSVELVQEQISSNEPSPLDRLLKKEQNKLLQAALAEISRECEELLRSFYIEGDSMEDIRIRQGLDTVQGVYYRRSICLGKVFRLLNKRWAGCSYERRAGLGRDLPSPEGEETLD
ncbi:MAG: sigma-70 family RNA polymerase sigma factor [Candidatus Krumholzibacteriota bacterium]